LLRSGRIDVGRLFGITVGFDLSWLIIAALVTYSLATGVFADPDKLPGASDSLRWLLGGVGAVCLFTSVLFHEFAHALAARQYGVGTRRITLFLFGGVAELDDEPPTPLAEFVIALAGPAASLVAALISFAVARVAGSMAGSEPLVVAMVWVAQINLMLALFNLVPAFPLDGGRVLRSILWWWRKDLLSATRISSAIGQGFAFILLGLGILRILASGSITDGVWLCLIGMFIRNAARSAYREVAWRQLLAGEPVSQFMRRDPVVVPRHISIEELMSSYVQPHRLSSFPVVDDRRLLGVVNARLAAQTPRIEWDRQSVGTLTEPCSTTNTVAPETDALEAFGRMRRGRQPRLLVVEGEDLVGTLTLADLLKGLSPRPS